MSKKLKKCRFRFKWEVDSRDTDPSKKLCEEGKGKKKVPRQSTGWKMEKTYRGCVQKVNDRLSRIKETQTKQGAS